MRKLLLICVCTMMVIVSSAQERKLGFGVKAGVAATSLTIPKGEKSQSSYRAGFTGGFFADYRFNSRWALSADLLYVRQGADIKLNGDGENRMKLDYLQIPVLVNFYLTRSLAVKAGIQPAFFLDGSEVYNSSIRSSSASTDWAIPVGLSYELNCGVIFEARYNAGVKYSVDEFGFPMHTVAFAFTVGYRFR